MALQNKTRKQKASPPKRSNSALSKDFRIVGIGASAGGLEALKAFFSSVQANIGMAFVIVTHQSPDHTSLLPDILSKQTWMKILNAKDGMRVKPDHIYISPPKHYMCLERGVLIFKRIPKNVPVSLPIDFFFRSLAAELQDKAICIVLSGAGSDGTLGIQSVKGEGGLAMAQDVHSAQFSSMPANAIATDQMDYVLPPDKMVQTLLEYVKTSGPRTKAETQSKIQDQMPELMSLLRQHTGNDFSFYKSNTLCRRAERRMNVHHISNPTQYIQYIRENTQETELLFKELLIGVTCFFRDPTAFEILAGKVLPDLLKDKANGDAVRIWVPGCSTGEEAYSIAILLQEYMDTARKQINIQIFATDLDDKAIQYARVGRYSSGIALDVSPERLQRFFIPEDSHFRIRKNIREMVVFATQNMIQDPSFTKLDLVSCRNLLIYLDGQMQKRIIPLFHYSLRPGGILFLGSSETIGSFTELFAPLDTRWKLFMRKETALPAKRLSRFMERPRMEDVAMASAVPVSGAKAKAPSIGELAQKLLLKQYVPPSAIVNEKGEIFYIQGRTGMYLEPSSGSQQLNQSILDMAREGLPLALAGIIRKAAAQEAEVLQKSVRVKSNGHYSMVDLRARRITEPEALRGLIWIAFEESEARPSSEQGKKKAAEKVQPAEDEQVERELQFIKQNLQSTIEELEASNEELKSTNEELQSTNEELQSANEELETAKEEMQSLNEELHTVNAELENRINDLSHANDDMKNLLNSTGIPTLFLDNKLNIKRFTIQAKKLIHLIQTDIGRPIGDIVTQLAYANLVKDANEVLHTLVYKSVEVRAHDWSWYMMRVMPYRTAENSIDGLVITFVDITKLKTSDILLAAYVTTLEQVARKASLKELLDKLLDTLEKQTAGLRCSISLYDKKSECLRLAIAPTLPEGFNTAIKTVPIGPRSDKPSALAALRRRHINFADIAGDGLKTEFGRLALKYGIKACWSQPIYGDGNKVLGVFTMYYQQPHVPSPVEKELINQAIPLMATAIAFHSGLKETEKK